MGYEPLHPGLRGMGTGSDPAPESTRSPSGTPVRASHTTHAERGGGWRCEEVTVLATWACSPSAQRSHGTIRVSHFFLAFGYPPASTSPKERRAKTLEALES